MITKEETRMLPIEQVQFDIENPRIKKSLEKYGDKLDEDRIMFALRSASEESNGSSSYSRLKGSILASGGVKSPIVVIDEGDGYICIDGNTRLAIYKEYLRDRTKGNWSEIKSTLVRNASEKDIETIRTAAHMVGSRPWPAFEKARYLHDLRHQDLMTFDELVELCGGSRTEIERQIQAYQDMNDYYREIVDDSAFHIDRFSGFVELQKPKIKEAIWQAGLDLKDFGEWIRDGKIYKLSSVRDLPKVLNDETAKKMFLEGGPRSIEFAVAELNSRLSSKNLDKVKLDSATLYQLAEKMTQTINDLPYREYRDLMDRSGSDVEKNIRILENLCFELQGLLKYAGE